MTKKEIEYVISFDWDKIMTYEERFNSEEEYHPFILQGFYPDTDELEKLLKTIDSGLYVVGTSNGGVEISHEKFWNVSKNYSKSEILKANGLDSETIITNANSSYFYQGGDNWSREFVAKVSGTAGNLERWVYGSLLEDQDGTYDLVYHADMSKNEALDLVDNW